VVKIKKYDTGTPEEFLRWRFILNEQMKNKGYSGNYDMELGPINVGGARFKACLSGRWAQDTKNKTRKAKDQTDYTLQQIYDCTIF
jgi:hypothetical protein